MSLHNDVGNTGEKLAYAIQIILAKAPLLRQLKGGANPQHTLAAFCVRHRGLSRDRTAIAEGNYGKFLVV